MPRFRLELDQNEMQLILNLLGAGYNGMIAKITEQLNAGPVQESPPSPPGNGAKPPEPPHA